jgi:tRNA modification GTPase
MKAYNINSPIFANITSVFSSSIIVVRLSGSKYSILSACQELRIDTSKLIHKTCFLSKLYSGKSTGNLLDIALITYFEDPKSFTGEHCLEISLHGSPFIFSEISKILLGIGYRMAEKGEFSYRAYLNGKLDLVEAEGMASLIASETEMQHKISLRQFNGENSKIFENLKNDILDIISNIESLIDFSDEELPIGIEGKITLKLQNLKNEISKYLQNNSIISLNEGLKIAIIGRPNVGKSSIFNKICGFQKAIVSQVPGTTRDVLEGKIVLKGVPIIFYDTAGIHTSQDEVEIEGIKRAIKTLHSSDIKLLIKSAEEKSESFEELAENFGFKIDNNTILVINKIDIEQNSSYEEKDIIKISTLKEENFDTLIDSISKVLEKNFLPLINAAVLTSDRQRSLLGTALELLERFNFQKDIELGAEDLRLSAQALEGIVGKIDIEDVLGSIFSKFCIGK